MKHIERKRIRTDFKVSVVSLLCLIILSSTLLAKECPINEFKQYTESLDKNKITLVDSLEEQYIKFTTGQSKQCKSMLFRDFRGYYNQITKSYIASVEEKLNEKYPLSAQKEKKYKSEFKKIGLRLDQSEGMYYVEADSAWFLKEFGKELPEAWNSYLKQWDYEAKNPFSDDGVILISFETFRERIVFWEKFLKKYPDFPEANSVEEIVSVYLSFYLSGLHSSLSFSHIPLSSNNIRRSYENFLKKNTQSKYFEIVKSQYTMIKANNFVIDEKVSKKLDDNYKKSIEKIKKKMINKIKSAYKYIHSSDLHQTNIIENSNNLPAPGVGTYKSLTTFSYDWKGGEPYVLRFIARSHTHAAKTYYEEYLLGEKGELLFALSEDEYKISTRYYFDGKSLIRVIKDKETYDHHRITKQMREKAVEVIKESKALSTMFNYISSH